jgi:hypothetical protein
MARRLIKVVLLALTVVGASLHTVPANANASFTIGDSVGPNATTTACPVNNVLVGFKSHTGTYVDGVRPICRPVDATGHWTGTATTLSAIGNMGASVDQHTTFCEQDTAVVKVTGHSGWWLDELTVFCQKLASPTATDSSQSFKHYVGGHDNGSTFESGDCHSQPVIAVKGTSGSYVNRLTFTCAALPTG